MSTLIKLKQSITANGIEIQELQIRRPIVRDMLNSTKSNGSNEEKEVALFANLCNVSPKDIEQLDLRDFFALQEAYSDFLS